MPVAAHSRRPRRYLAIISVFAPAGVEPLATLGHPIASYNYAGFLAVAARFIHRNARFTDGGLIGVLTGGADRGSDVFKRSRSHSTRSDLHNGHDDEGNGSCFRQAPEKRLWIRQECFDLLKNVFRKNGSARAIQMARIKKVLFRQAWSQSPVDDGEHILGLDFS